MRGHKAISLTLCILLLFSFTLNANAETTWENISSLMTRYNITEDQLPFQISELTRVVPIREDNGSVSQTTLSPYLIKTEGKHSGMMFVFGTPNSVKGNEKDAKGEWRYLGYSANGNKFSNMNFEDDVNTGLDPHEKAWILEPWFKKNPKTNQKYCSYNSQMAQLKNNNKEKYNKIMNFLNNEYFEEKFDDLYISKHFNFHAVPGQPLEAMAGAMQGWHNWNGSTLYQTFNIPGDGINFIRVRYALFDVDKDGHEADKHVGFVGGEDNFQTIVTLSNAIKYTVKPNVELPEGYTIRGSKIAMNDLNTNGEVPLTERTFSIEDAEKELNESIGIGAGYVYLEFVCAKEVEHEDYEIPGIEPPVPVKDGLNLKITKFEPNKQYTKVGTSNRYLVTIHNDSDVDITQADNVHLKVSGPNDSETLKGLALSPGQIKTIPVDLVTAVTGEQTFKAELNLNGDSNVKEVEYKDNTAYTKATTYRTESKYLACGSKKNTGSITFEVAKNTKDIARKPCKCKKQSHGHHHKTLSDEWDYPTSTFKEKYEIQEIWFRSKYTKQNFPSNDGWINVLDPQYSTHARIKAGYGFELQTKVGYSNEFKESNAAKWKNSGSCHGIIIRYFHLDPSSVYGMDNMHFNFNLEMPNGKMYDPNNSKSRFEDASEKFSTKKSEEYKDVYYAKYASQKKVLTDIEPDEYTPYHVTGTQILTKKSELYTFKLKENPIGQLDRKYYVDRNVANGDYQVRLSAYGGGFGINELCDEKKFNIRIIGTMYDDLKTHGMM